METNNNCKVTDRRAYKVRRFVLPLLLLAVSILVIPVKQSVANSPPVKADKYYVRVSGCDDGGKAYLNNRLVVDVGFDEDSNWLDITEDVAHGKDEIKFEVINKTGAITYVFQVKKNDTIIFEQACGKIKEIGCENNRAFRVGKARKFTYTIRKDE
jgi:hypothetical protein